MARNPNTETSSTATISLTAASEGEKTHRSVDLLGRVYDWSGATKPERSGDSPAYFLQDKPGQTAAGSPKGERGGAHQYFLTRFASAEGKNGGVAKCEVRSASVEGKTLLPFVIRNSSSDISRADIGKEHAATSSTPSSAPTTSSSTRPSTTPTGSETSTAHA